MTASDFIEPKGRLNTDMFPLTEEEVEEGELTALTKLLNYVGQWLTLAEGLTTSVSAQRHYVYYRAYDTLITRLTMSPMKASLDGQGSIAFEMEQITLLAAQRDRHLSEYERIAAVEESERAFGGQYLIVGSLR